MTSYRRQAGPRHEFRGQKLLDGREWETRKYGSAPGVSAFTSLTRTLSPSTPWSLYPDLCHLVTAVLTYSISICTRKMRLPYHRHMPLRN